jgi:membrane protease YdiL (CAAX protease family)
VLNGFQVKNSSFQEEKMYSSTNPDLSKSRISQSDVAIKGKTPNIAAMSPVQKSTLAGLPIPQHNIATILFMFAWPAAWYTVLIYVIGRYFIPTGGTTPTWLRMIIIILSSGAELAAGLVLLRREGYQLTIASLRSRISLQWPKGWKAWGVAVLVLIVGMALSMAMGPLNRALASVSGFMPPAWWGPASNPTVAVNSAADVFTDIHLVGNYGFVLFYFIIGLVFNIFGEEIYYRGYLLPRMKGVFGSWGWVANGTLFTLKHVYQRWLWPGLLIGGLSFAFAAGPLGSLPLAMVYHWVGNFLIQMFSLVQVALGI